MPGVRDKVVVVTGRVPAEVKEDLRRGVEQSGGKVAARIGAKVDYAVTIQSGRSKLGLDEEEGGGPALTKPKVVRPKAKKPAAAVAASSRGSKSPSPAKVSAQKRTPVKQVSPLRAPSQRSSNRSSASSSSNYSPRFVTNSYWYPAELQMNALNGSPTKTNSPRFVAEPSFRRLSGQSSSPSKSSAGKGKKQASPKVVAMSPKFARILQRYSPPKSAEKRHDMRFVKSGPGFITVHVDAFKRPPRNTPTVFQVDNEDDLDDIVGITKLTVYATRSAAGKIVFSFSTAVNAAVALEFVNAFMAQPITTAYLNAVNATHGEAEGASSRADLLGNAVYVEAFRFVRRGEYILETGS